MAAVAVPTRRPGGQTEEEEVDGGEAIRSLYWQPRVVAVAVAKIIPMRAAQLLLIVEPILLLEKKEDLALRQLGLLEGSLRTTIRR
jgi:hypothetical protein